MMQISRTFTILVLGISVARYGVAADGSENAGKSASREDTAGENAIQEVVVTARRREENILEVPAAITVLSAETLRNQRINDTIEIATLIPGLTAGTAQGVKSNVTYNIRGLGNTIGGKPSVLTYSNEVPLSNVIAPIYDLSSVQVFKGPQGTLFGASSNGGAVLFTTQRASFEKIEGYAEVSAGDFDYKEFRGAVNLPLVNDVLALRLATDIIRRDGTTEVINQPGLRLDDKHSNSVRASAKFRPIDWLTNDTIYEFFRQKRNGPAFVIGYVSPDNDCGPTAVQNFVCIYGFDAVHADFEAQQARGPWKIATTIPRADWPDYQENIQRQSVMNISDAALSDTITLRNIFGYVWEKNFPVGRAVDLDGTAFPGYEVLNGNNPTVVDAGVHIPSTNHLTEEFQIQGTFDRKFDFVTGAYYQYDKNPAGLVTFVGLPLFTIPLPAGLASNDKERAIYAQSTIHGELVGLDRFSLTLGGRKTWNKGHASLGRPESEGGEVLAKSDALTYTVSLDYKPTERLLFYLAHRKGYKPGGANAQVLTTQNAQDYQTFAPETVKDVEFGIKSQFSVAGIDGSLNVAAYKSWYDDPQRVVNVSATSSVTVNAAGARVKGFEIENILELTPRLQIFTSYAYIDPVFTTFLAPNFGDGLAGTPVIFRDLSDSDFSGTAKHTISARAAYEVPLMPEDWGKLTVSGTFFSQSKSFDNDENAGIAAAKLAGYDLKNARLDWRGIAGLKLDAALFVNNISNTAYKTGGVSFQIPTSGEAQYYYGDPRTYGVELRYSF